MASLSEGTAQFPVARDDTPPPGGGRPAHAARSGTGDDASEGVTRGGWWAITLTAAALLLVGFLLTFGPARYWTPIPVVFLGYFLISGLIGLVFWKGVRELRDSNPTLHSDQPASPGARVAAAIGAVGIASALVLLPAGLSAAPANAFPCPDGSTTCGPNPGPGGPTVGPTGGNTTAPQAPNTTVPPAADTGLMQPPTQGINTPTVTANVPTMPTAQAGPDDCIVNCGPTQAPQAPATGEATVPQTGQNPVTTPPNTPATTPRVPTTTPQLRTPTPETTTSSSSTSSSSKSRDSDDRTRSSREDRDKNSGIPYQAAEIASLVGTYRRKKTVDAVRDGQVVAENEVVQLSASTKFVQGDEPVQPGVSKTGWLWNPGKSGRPGTWTKIDVSEYLSKPRTGLIIDESGSDAPTNLNPDAIHPTNTNGDNLGSTVKAEWVNALLVAARENGVPPELLAAQIDSESSWQMDVTASDNLSYGLSQARADAWNGTPLGSKYPVVAQHGPFPANDQRNNPLLSIFVAAQYDRQAIDKLRTMPGVPFANDPARQLLDGYNGGYSPQGVINGDNNVDSTGLGYADRIFKRTLPKYQLDPSKPLPPIK